MDKKKIGKFLRGLRQEKGLTQEGMVEEFSLCFGGYCDVITTTTVGKWERGESFPNMDNVKDLSRFFNVTIDEIFSGERAPSQNFEEKYFIYNNDWAQKSYPEDVNLKDVWGQNALEIEVRFNQLLEKLVQNELSPAEEKEFDFICTHFYEVNELDAGPGGEMMWYNLAGVELERFKAKLKKQVNDKTSMQEKIWEACKPLVYKKGVNFWGDLCNNLFVGQDKILAERIKNSPDVHKDMLLSFLQKNEIILKHNQQLVTSEEVTKDVIKALIKNGACLNDCFLEERVIKKESRTSMLFLLYDSYSKQKGNYVVAVKDGKERLYYSIENTPTNRKLLGAEEVTWGDISVEEFERRWRNGERLIKKQYEEKEGIPVFWVYEALFLEEWIRGEEAQSNQRSYMKYMKKLTNEMTYAEFCQGRNTKKTKMLLKDLNKLSLQEIKTKYFMVENKNME